MRFFQAFEFQRTETCWTSSNTNGVYYIAKKAHRIQGKNPNRTSLSGTLAGNQKDNRGFVLFLSLSLSGVTCCWFAQFYSFCRLTFPGKMSAPVPESVCPVSSSAYHSCWRKLLCLLLKILVRIRLDAFICPSTAVGHTGCLWVTCPSLVLWAVTWEGQSPGPSQTVQNYP